MQTLPQDPRLPQLPVLFDVAAMGRLIADELVGSERHDNGVPAGAYGELDRCEIERIKYRPRRNCLVGYRIRIRHGRWSPARWQRVFVAMYPEQEHAGRFERLRLASATSPVAAGAGVRWLPRIGSLLWAFPRDRKLSSLPLLCDPVFLREQCLPSLAESRWEGLWQVRSAARRVVSYFPEHSCTLVAKVRLGRRLSSQARVWTVYGKTRYDDAGERTFAAMRILHESDAQDSGHAGFARPLAYEPQVRFLWQEAVPGRTLDSVLRHTAGEDRSVWPRVARAVAALHRTAVPDLAVPLKRETVLEELMRAEETVSLTCPDSAPALRSCMRELLLEPPDFDSRATLHGDLHSNNIIIGTDRAFLIDLDRIGCGPPCAELGSLLAELAYRDCLAARAPDFARLDAIAEEYARHVSWPMDRREVRWHLAAALVRERAYRCVTSLKPGRVEAVPRLLAAATDALRCAA